MFDNPQQEVKNMSKKLRPIKMSDEEFELFYKEIYAEFGPKGVPAFDRNAQAEDPVEEPVAEEISQEAPTATPVYYPHEEAIQENTAKAAAVIRNVKKDQVIDEHNKEVKIVKKEKGIAGLVVTLCIECLAIAGVVAYWMIKIL